MVTPQEIASPSASTTAKPVPPSRGIPSVPARAATAGAGAAPPAIQSSCANSGHRAACRGPPLASSARNQARQDPASADSGSRLDGRARSSAGASRRYPAAAAPRTSASARGPAWSAPGPPRRMRPSVRASSGCASSSPSRRCPPARTAAARSGAASMSRARARDTGWPSRASRSAAAGTAPQRRRPCAACMSAIPLTSMGAGASPSPLAGWMKE